VISDEMDKLSHLEPSSLEFNVTRNYLDWLTLMPWGLSKAENFDIARAEHILNAEHFGMLDVKDRILEFIAVRKLLSDQAAART
jgi:Lon-like ATP-dependent protease